jgi:hypothetical protein
LFHHRQQSEFLLQARTALACEGVVEAARHEVAARVEAAAKAEQAASDKMQVMMEERDELRLEANRKEGAIKAFSQVCTVTRHRLIPHTCFLFNLGHTSL